jgi:hypothetical protein
MNRIMKMPDNPIKNYRLAKRLGCRVRHRRARRMKKRPKSQSIGAFGWWSIWVVLADDTELSLFGSD